jgi:hypothetical protein
MGDFLRTASGKLNAFNLLLVDFGLDLADSQVWAEKSLVLGDFSLL